VLRRDDGIAGQVVSRRRLRPQITRRLEACFGSA